MGVDFILFIIFFEMTYFNLHLSSYLGNGFSINRKFLFLF